MTKEQRGKQGGGGAGGGLRPQLEGGRIDKEMVVGVEWGVAGMVTTDLMRPTRPSFCS